MVFRFPHGSTVLLILVTLFLPLYLLVILNFTFWQRIYPNVYINNIPVGGKQKIAAAALVIDQLEKRPRYLEINTPAKKYTLNEETIGIQYDVTSTLQKAFMVGRSPNILEALKERATLIHTPHNLPIDVKYSDQKLDVFVASLSAQLNDPFIPPAISLLDKNGIKTASVSAGKSGKVLNAEATKTLIRDAFAIQSQTSITLPIQTLTRKPSESQISQTHEVATNLIGKTLQLRQGTMTWDLTDDELINFLSVYDLFDEGKISSWIHQFAQTVNKPPENALFEFDGQKVTTFKPAQPGITLDEAKMLEAIKTGIQTLATISESTHAIEVPFTQTDAQITTAEVNSIGIKELIGKGESWFSHSIPGRVHNVTLAASKIHGVVIPPGETFSFTKTVGDIDAQHGYLPAYVIQNGKTVLGDGGGVCQVSSTLFRAMLDAGLDITERHAHAYRVGYYEENSDPGIDATIFSPSVDLKFVNDTPAHILIQAKVDPQKMYMTFELYGTKDNRHVEMTKPTIWSQLPPPPDVYQDDPTLAVGVVKQVDFKAWGANVSFDWKVTRDNQVIHEQTFKSFYKPWAAVYLKGTKTP